DNAAERPVAAGCRSGVRAMGEQLTIRNPWDQREGEPAAAYARFLAYRNLGPSRTVALAVASVEASPELQTARRTGRGRKGPERDAGAGAAEPRSHPPRRWRDDAARWEWAARADAWDIARLTEAGERVQVHMTELMCRLAAAALNGLETAPEPKTWQEAL